MAHLHFELTLESPPRFLDEAPPGPPSLLRNPSQEIGCSTQKLPGLVVHTAHQNGEIKALSVVLNQLKINTLHHLEHFLYRHPIGEKVLDTAAYGCFRALVDCV